MHLAFISGHSSRHSLSWCKGVKRSDTEGRSPQCVPSAVVVILVLFVSTCICIAAISTGSHMPCLDQTAVWMPKFDVSHKHETDIHSLTFCSLSDLYYLILDSSEAWHNSSQRIQRKIPSKGGWEQHLEPSVYSLPQNEWKCGLSFLLKLRVHSTSF